jgi:hypothetical protein
MATNEEGTPGCPDVIYGVLQAGETTTRRFSCRVGRDYQVLVSRPMGETKIVEQSDQHVTLANESGRIATFIVSFPARRTVAAIMGAKQMIDALRQSAAERETDE